MNLSVRPLPCPHTLPIGLGLRGSRLVCGMVGPAGIEPTTYGLKVRCSTN